MNYWEVKTKRRIYWCADYKYDNSREWWWWAQHDLKKQSSKRVSKDNMIIQEAWSDADTHDRQITDAWDRADNNSVQKQYQQKESQSVYKK